MEEVTTMANVVSSIATALSIDNLWTIVGNTTSLIVIAVTFALGYTLVRRLVRGISKGKLKD